MKKYRRPKYLVPLLNDGSLVYDPGERFPQPWRAYGAVGPAEPIGYWAEPVEFQAILRYRSLHRTRSTTVMNWQDVMNEHRIYPMFLRDLDKVLRYCEFQSGNLIDGLWRFCKHSTNYGIAPVLTEEQP